MNDNSYREGQLLNILDLLRLHLCEARFTENAYGTELSPAAAFILVCIEEENLKNLESCAKLLGIDKSTVSRNIKALCAAKYVKKNPSGSKTKFSLCKAGENFIKMQDAFNLQQVSERLRRLNSAEQQKLLYFFSAFTNNEVKQKKLTIESLALQLISLIRILSFQLGIVGKNFLGTNLSTTEWILFSEIHYNQSLPSELAALLSLPPSWVTQKITKYEKNKLLRTEKSQIDGRAKHLTLTSKGLQYLSKIETAALKSFDTWLEKLSDKELSESASILSKYINKSSTARGHWINSNTIATRVTSNEQVLELRHFAITNLAELKNKNYPLTSTLFDEKNLLIKITESNKLIGALELKNIDAQYIVLNAILREKATIKKAEIVKIIESFCGCCEKDTQISLQNFF